MLQLNEREWADFLLTDYFEIAKGNQNNMAELQIGAMPLISAKKIDNGCKGFFAANSKPIFKGHCLTINNDGDGGMQKYKIYCLYPNNWGYLSIKIIFCSLIYLKAM